MLKALVIALAFVGFAAHAEETMGEKAKDAAHDAGRAMKKAGHRIKEAVCMKGDAKCLAQKAKHRAQEAGDAVSDKASEIKNDVDHK